MGKQSLDNAIRVDIMNKLTALISEELNMDVIPVEPSALAVPVVDAEGNEKFVKLVVSVPHGKRDGNGGYIPYDGYKEGELYKEDLALDAKKELEREAEKKAKEVERERKREEKRRAREAKEAK